MSQITINSSQVGDSFKQILLSSDIQPGDEPSYQICKLLRTITLKQKENVMIHKLALSASVLALAGSLALAPGGRAIAATSSLSTMHWLASDIYKADVYDNAENKIGVVTDLIMDTSGNVTTAVVGVGGFLGAGKKDVAVPFKDLKVMSRDGKDWLVLNQTKDQLKMAPAYEKKNNSPM